MRLRTRPKYGNQKMNGSASKREANRLAELRLLEASGLISDLRTQVRYQLIPAQYTDGKCVERAVTYTADFVYKAEFDGKMREEVEDAKGVRTQQYVIRRKLMLFVHGIRIREV
jgi:hypothetical protein